MIGVVAAVYATMTGGEAPAYALALTEKATTGVLVPVAKIAEDGTSSIVTGMTVNRREFGRTMKRGEERQSMLS